MNCTWKASRCVSGLQDLAHHKVRLFPQRKGQSDVWMHGFRPQNPSANWLPLPSPTTLHNSSPAQPKLPAKIYPAQCTCPCCSLRYSPGFLSELRPPAFSRPFLPAKEATSVRMERAGGWGGHTGHLSAQAERRAEQSPYRKNKQLELPIILGGPRTGTATFKQPGLPVLLLWFPGSDLQWLTCQSISNSLPGHPREPRGRVFGLVGFLRSPSLFPFSRFGVSLVRSNIKVWR